MAAGAVTVAAVVMMIVSRVIAHRGSLLFHDDQPPEWTLSASIPTQPLIPT